MTKKSMFSLLFYISKSKIKQNGECPVMMRITIDGRSVAMRTKRFVKPEDWSQDKLSALGKSSSALSLNLYLDALRAKAYNKYTELLTINDEVFPELLRDAILGINSAAPKMLMEIWKEHNVSLKQLIEQGKSYSNWLKYETCKKYFQEFLKSEYKISDISVKTLTRDQVLKFEFYLLTTKKCNFNTTKKYLQFFKKVVMISFKNGWLKTNPFADISLTLKETDRPYLNQSEIDSIINKEFQNERLSFVKDMFLFSCYTGLAYIDIYKLKKSEIEVNPNGIYWIRTRRQKTGVKAHIPLLEFPSEILKKYTTLIDLKGDDRVFNLISNQKVNAYLKEIGDLCGIEKNLTFHIARHTFATTVTMMNGVPMESVSKMLGHKDLRSTQHYARIVDEKVGNDMIELANKMLKLRMGV